jgi:hypothetical protein
VRGGKNREKWRDDPVLPALMGVLLAYRGMVRKTILKNIALVTRALLTLFSGARSGNGMLSKSAIARCLPLESSAKARQTRLYRLLSNPHFTPEAMVPLLVALAVGTSFKGRLPMILDQTSFNGLPTLLIGLIFEGRVLPVALSCFSHEGIVKSQNAIEYGLMLTVAACFSPENCPVLVMDRGYARVRLFPQLASAGIPFLIRAPRNVCVYIEGKPKALGRFIAPRGSLSRYEVLYHGTIRYPVDLIVYHGKTHEEPWYLIVPRRFGLTAREIADLYAKRMCVEQGFRDLKTHLGLRGLTCVSRDPSFPMTRLLLACALGYLIILALGASPKAKELRPLLEIPRRQGRHGTTRTLSVLFMGLLRLSLDAFRAGAWGEIQEILLALRKGKGIAFYNTA